MKTLALAKLVGGVALAVACNHSAHAALEFSFGQLFSGKQAPDSSAPWLKASFANEGSGGVKLTLTASLSDPGEFIGDVYFNLDPALDPTKVSISGTPVGGFLKGVNGFNADGDGLYDLVLGMSQGGNKFDGAETQTFSLTYTGSGTFDENSFNFLSFPHGGLGPFHAAAHLQGLPTGPGLDGSTWIAPGPAPSVAPVPEASTVIGMAMLGLPIGFGVFRQLRRSR